MEIRDWASLSLIVLALEGLIITIIEGFVLYYIIRGIIALRAKLSELLPKLKGYSQNVERIAQATSLRIASPLIAASSTAAQVHQMQRVLLKPLRKQSNKP